MIWFYPFNDNPRKCDIIFPREHVRMGRWDNFYGVVCVAPVNDVFVLAVLQRAAARCSPCCFVLQRALAVVVFTFLVGPGPD